MQAGRAVALVYVHIATLASEARCASAAVITPQVGASPTIGAGAALALVHLQVTGGTLQAGGTAAAEVGTYKG